MHFLIDFFVVWLSISLVILATGWYAAVIIPSAYPHWWKQVVVDTEPDRRITQR